MGLAAGADLTILGGFIDYSATFEHLDGVGNKKLSLVEGVEIHELIHIVRGTGALADGRPDFLANDIADLYDRPDTLHLSDGSVQPVSVVLDAIVDSGPTTADLQVQLTARLPAGFAYLRAPDPGNGKFRLARVVRSDGLDIPLGENAWMTDRTFLGNARRPVVENTLHLFDRDSTGSHTLFYALPPDLMKLLRQRRGGLAHRQHCANRSHVVGPGQRGRKWCAVLRCFRLHRWRTVHPVATSDDRSWRRLSRRSRQTYSFYSAATDNAGNREASPAAADASTKVTRINRALTLNRSPTGRFRKAIPSSSNPPRWIRMVTNSSSASTRTCRRTW
jgi:hypothetical protein